MIPYKNRKVQWNKPTRVYRNLNLPKTEGWYSIMQQFDKLGGGSK